MPCSPAQLEANRKNALRSSGPKTVEGKERSRANALKHGMTGDGVVLLEEDQGEVAKLAAELEAEMRPSGAMGRILLNRIAVLSVRLDRCVEHDEVTTAKRVRDAAKTHREARHEEVNALGMRLADDPEAAVRCLKETAEGIEWLVAQWLSIKGQLLRPKEILWQAYHLKRIENLVGRHGNAYPPGRFDAPGRAVMGDFAKWDEGKHLRSGAKRKALARETVAAMIDAEVEALQALAATLDDDDDAHDRAEAPVRALFDPSDAAERARRYEAAAERGMFRALREFRQVEETARSGEPTSPPASPDKTKPIERYRPPAEPVHQPTSTPDPATNPVVPQPIANTTPPMWWPNVS